MTTTTRTAMIRLSSAAAILSVAAMLIPAAAADDSAMAVFEQRIMPIFRSPQPSSCVQCHLSSVDLKDYIRPSHEETFLSLRDQGLIDLQHPEKSKILTLIQMGDLDQDAMAKRIHAKTRQAEYDAFAAWIESCCHDQTLTSRPALQPAQLAKPAHSDEVIRHARKDRILDSFVRNVWSQRMRCFPCHTPDELDANNPQHEKPIQRHRELVQQYGARMNLFRGSPAESMQSLIASSRKTSAKSLPLLNLQDPANSLLVLKPIAKLPAKQDNGEFEKPSAIAPVSHMGGLKMHVDDVSYKAFVGWIADLARVQQGNYQSADDLPADNWYPSQQVLRIKDLPSQWKPGQLVQVMVHAKANEGDWNPVPIAFTQGAVTPRGFINGSLFLMKPDHDEAPATWAADAASLQPGDYLLKLYLDQDNVIARDATALLIEQQPAMTIEHAAQWRDGFKNAEVVSAVTP